VSRTANARSTALTSRIAGCPVRGTLDSLLDPAFACL
jgi:hypothetical protein